MIMKFNERLKELREKSKLTQEQLAKISGVSSRMIQRYEYGTSRPRLDAAEKLAKALNVTTDQLLGNGDMLVAQAAEKYGSRGAKQAQQILEQAAAMFAGGELSDEDKTAFMDEIQMLYLDSKKRARKFTPKKYLKEK